MTAKPMTFAQAAREFFNLGTTGETMKQVKALSDKDKEEIADGLRKIGYNIVSSLGATKTVPEGVMA